MFDERRWWRFFDLNGSNLRFSPNLETVVSMKVFCKEIGGLRKNSTMFSCNCTKQGFILNVLYI